MQNKQTSLKHIQHTYCTATILFHYFSSGFFNSSNDVRYNGIQNYQSRRCSSDTSACRIIMAESHITGAKPPSIYSMSIHICMCERLHRSITVHVVYVNTLFLSSLWYIWLCLHAWLFMHSWCSYTVSEHDSNYADCVPSHVVQLYMLRFRITGISERLEVHVHARTINEPCTFPTKYIATSIYENSKR